VIGESVVHGNSFTRDGVVWGVRGYFLGKWNAERLDASLNRSQEEPALIAVNPSE
jgi:hypothetical protein